MNDTTLPDERRGAAVQYYGQATQYAEGLDTKPDRGYDLTLAFLRKHLPMHASLLEIGCGTGRLAELVAAQQAGSITATDVSPLFIEKARRRVHPRVTYEVADAMDLPYPDGAFDGVYTYQAVEHFPWPMRGLDEVARVTRPGGVICIITPNLASPVHPVKRLAKCLLRTEGQSLRLMEHGHHVALTCLHHVVTRIIDTVRLRSSHGVFFFPSREPDYSADAHGDSDATWVCNPVDMRRFLERRGCALIEVRGGRTWWLGSSFAGSTHLAVRREREIG